MEEIIKKINELEAYLTSEELEKMTPEQRTTYMNLIEKLQARVDTLADILEGGDE